MDVSITCRNGDGSVRVFHVAAPLVVRHNPTQLAVAQLYRASAHPSPVRSMETDTGDHDAIFDTEPTGDDITGANARTATVVVHAMTRLTIANAVRSRFVAMVPVSFRLPADTRAGLGTAATDNGSRRRWRSTGREANLPVLH